MRFALALAVACSLFGSAVEAKPFRSGPWEGFVAKDKDGCLMVQKLDARSSFVLSMDQEGQTSVGIYNKAWSFQVDQAFSGALLVDQDPPVQLSGRATSPDTVMLKSEQWDLVRTLLDGGRVARLQIANAGWAQIGLRGVAKANEKLGKCAASYANADNDAPEQASGARSFRTFKNSDIPGGDFGAPLKNVNFGECRESCADKPTCVAFTFNTRHRWCFLKSRIGELKAEPQAISGMVKEEEKVSKKADDTSAGEKIGRIPEMFFGRWGKIGDKCKGEDIGTYIRA